MRRAYRCACDGQSHRAEPIDTPLARAVRGELEAIEAEQGERPSTCPWRAYADPDVVAVIQAYDFWESGQCAEWWGADPELWLVQACRYYHRALATARDAVDKVRRNNNGAASVRPPIGHVVERIRG